MNKQIEDLAECLIEIQRNFDEYCGKPCRECDLCGVLNCESHYKAEALYNAGYRKASDVAREIMRDVRQAFLNMVLSNSMGEMYDIEKRFAEIEKQYEREEEE